VTRRKGEKVSMRRHRKWTMREIKTSTFPLFALRSSLSSVGINNKVNIHLRRWRLIMAERRRRLVQHRHLLALQQRMEVLGGTRHILGHHHRPAAIQQRAEQLPYREVEGVQGTGKQVFENLVKGDPVTLQITDEPGTPGNPGTPGTPNGGDEVTLTLTGNAVQEGRGHQQQGQHSFAKVALNHLSALTAGHFLSNATKSNQKTLAV
ncbi:hypothetical protein V0R39_26540, partial [Pseudomonas inefficax]|nr:hypothetical protein [Pseudomonas inefficax]